MSNNQQPQSPRHWHGTVGDRYEHLNVWVRGGPPETYRRPSIPTTTAATATSDRRVCLNSFCHHPKHLTLAR
ncbi:hypothetical protein ASPTUDRAFT_46783 [Aspergillus tubingensis CBS 134.48]|uniref:Uncharacterized protein n=1 Tax=Aspergillus tubingensis (strain CBS 134.48) TaxID=767770 RepID=A0A1L9MWJ9_ASPTC|nr:hypothetical protein ASPTUDRAFT_46783 [Aspergillus tubingensis CBS 134.48]